MKQIIIMLSLLLSIFIATGQIMAQETELSKKERKKLEKEDKKKQKEASQIAEFNNAKEMAETKRFVFTGSEMFTPDGSAPLNARINFFYLEGDEATLQFAFEGLQFIPNPNGLGGVTSKGKVTKYTFKADNPKKPVSIQVTVQPLAGQGSGIHQLVLTIYGDDYAELLLQSSNVRVKGSIVKPEDSKIYEGTSR